jgi:hypothetical protein
MVLTTQMSTVQNYILNLEVAFAYEELKVSPRFNSSCFETYTVFGNVKLTQNPKELSGLCKKEIQHRYQSS